jgi:hypothetical protein
LELSDENDLKFALGILADPKIKRRIAMGVMRAVRDSPIEWLTNDKHIPFSRSHYRGFTAGLPLPGWPFFVVMLGSSCNL